MQVATEQERWIAIYHANPCLKKAGILLETFVAYPLELMELFFFSQQGIHEINLNPTGYITNKEKIQ